MKGGEEPTDGQKAATAAGPAAPHALTSAAEQQQPQQAGGQRGAPRGHGIPGGRLGSPRPTERERPRRERRETRATLQWREEREKEKLKKKKNTKQPKTGVKKAKSGFQRSSPPSEHAAAPGGRGAVLRERGRRGRAATCAILRVRPPRRAALRQGPRAYRVGAAPSLGAVLCRCSLSRAASGVSHRRSPVRVFFARAAPWITAEASVLSGLPSLLLGLFAAAASRLSSERHSLMMSSHRLPLPGLLTALPSPLFPHRWRSAGAAHAISRITRLKTTCLII